MRVRILTPSTKLLFIEYFRYNDCVVWTEEYHPPWKLSRGGNLVNRNDKLTIHTPYTDQHRGDANVLFYGEYRFDHY